MVPVLTMALVLPGHGPHGEVGGGKEVPRPTLQSLPGCPLYGLLAEGRPQLCNPPLHHLLELGGGGGGELNSDTVASGY